MLAGTWAPILGGMPQLDGCPSGSCTSALGLDKGSEWARFDSQSRATLVLGPQSTRPASAQVKDRFRLKNSVDRKGSRLRS